MSAKAQPALTDLPPVPPGAVFKLDKVAAITIPHPYMITPRHVSWAADHWGGMLSADAIRDAEKKNGAMCDICRARGQSLTYDQHETQTTLFIIVPQNTDLNAVPGLHAYLWQHKDRFISLGIDGFAFPTQ